MSASLVLHRPFDPVPALASLVAHAVPGVETVDGDVVRRVVRVGDEPALVEVTLGPDEIAVRSTAGSQAELEALATSWFGLADDLDTVRDAFEDDAVLGPLVRARPRLRILGHPDGFEAAVTTVLGQQVSLAAARTFGGRLAAAYGDPGPGGLTTYPTPARLASVDVGELQSVVRVTHARARTVHALARACADGLSLGSPDVRDDLLALPGIGPWTADYLALRVLGDRDAMPVGDLVLRRALGAGTVADVTRLAEQWRPLRAFAAVHLWTSTAYVL
ncbi:DNA-3-methyladenine glycosylase family protein [Cellulomonas sp. P5_C5]